MAQHHYQALNSDHTSHNIAIYRQKLWYLVVGLFIYASTVSLILVHNPYTSLPKSVRYTYNDSDDRTFECGITVSEAMAAGCEFDPVTFAWLPERCLDRELADELVNHTTWTLHADPDGKFEKSDMAFAANETTTYITNANHVLHCLYSWKRLHRLLLAGKPYHSGMAYRHTAHCSHMILDSFNLPPDQIQNKALVVVPAC
jgi:hypothetical protein